MLALFFELDEFEQEATCDLAALEAAFEEESSHPHYWGLITKMISLFKAHQINNNYSERLQNLLTTRKYEETNNYLKNAFCCYHLENDFAEEATILAIINYVEVCILYYSTYQKLVNASG